MKRCWLVLFAVVMVAGCAEVRTRAEAPVGLDAASSGALAGALRVCAWGNGPACADLERRLAEVSFAARSAQAAVLTGLVRDAAGKPDLFSAAVQRCRAGESRPCDDAAQALARTASGTIGGDALAEALLDTLDREPHGIPQPGILTIR
jgi:hypothetical protein